MSIPQLIAHRGASFYAPENTFAAFEIARQMSAQWIESDVMLSQDGIAILHHDDSLKRTTGVMRMVNQSTWDFLKTLDAGSWFSPRFQGEKIPRLDDTLDWLKGHHMGLNLEIKPTFQADIITTETMLRVLQESRFPKEKLLISSFSLIALQKAFELAPHYAYGLLCADLKDLEIGLDSRLPFKSVHLEHHLATPELIKRLKAQDFRILVYTVNNFKQAQSFFEKGVSAVFSDKPDLLSLETGSSNYKFI